MPDIAFRASKVCQYRLQEPGVRRARMCDRKRHYSVAASLETLAPPTGREIRVLRAEIDPGQAVAGRTAKA